MLGGLALVMFIFCMITVSDVGFPYRPKTNVMRADFMVSGALLIFWKNISDIRY